MESREFKQFQTLIYEKSGISLGDGKESLVSTRIGKRLKALGLSTQKEYLEYLKGSSGAEELVEFLNVISTNVTNFFRESEHFDFLETALREWSSRGQRRFRIWSAASSTGEEPYTIAMTSAFVANNPGVDFKILATDISTKVLHTAIAGVYPMKEIEDIPHSFRQNNFLIKNTETFEISPILKQLTSFGRLNLSKPPFPMSGPFDVIFCRNVMIYFDQTVRSRLVEEMFRLLRPGGYLMVGHSETLTGINVPLRAVRPSIYFKEGD